MLGVRHFFIACYCYFFFQMNLSALMSAPPPPSSAPPLRENSSPFLLPRLLHSETDRDSWKRLSHTHWPALFALYDVSVYGGYVSVLPPVQLSVAISPETARQIRYLRNSRLSRFLRC